MWDAPQKSSQHAPGNLQSFPAGACCSSFIYRLLAMLMIWMLQFRKGAHQILVLHLGRDAAVVQTGAARGALIQQSDSPALVSGLRSYVRSRSRADDDKIEFVHGSSKIEFVAQISSGFLPSNIQTISRLIV